MANKTELTKDIIRALKQVYDPEISVNIYDLGLIYELKVDEAKSSGGKVERPEYEAYVKMTMTSPTCPLADELIRDVEEAVRDVPGIKDVKIELVFEPEWDQSRMSDEAKLELGLM